MNRIDDDGLTPNGGITLWDSGGSTTIFRQVGGQLAPEDMEFILRQLRRLEVFHKRKMPPEAVAVYIEACMSAGSRDVLSKVIGSSARYGDKFPLPKEIIDAVVEELKQKGLVATSDCRACGGSRLIQVMKPYGGSNPMLKQMYGETLLPSSEKCPHCKPIIRELPQEPKRESSLIKPNRDEGVLQGLFDE
jgi:hypothetical protein